MSTPRRRFRRELKLEAVRRVQETGRTQTQVAEEIGVSANTLCRWMKQFQIEKSDPFPCAYHLIHPADIRTFEVLL